MAVVAVGVIGFVVLGRDNKKGPSAVDKSLVEYCNLAAAFDVAVPVGGDGAVTNTTPVEEIGKRIQALGASMEALKRASPQSVRSDVAVVVRTVQEAAGGKVSGLKSAGYVDARNRLADFQQNECAGAGTTDTGEQGS